MCGPQEKEFAWSRTLLKAVSVSPVNMCGVVAYRYAVRKSLQDDRVLMGCPAEPLYSTINCMPFLCLTFGKLHGKNSQQAGMTTSRLAKTGLAGGQSLDISKSDRFQVPSQQVVCTVIS